MTDHEDDTALAARLRARLDTLTVERQKALDQAQRQLAAYDAAIAELAALLDPPAATVAPDVHEAGAGPGDNGRTDAPPRPTRRDARRQPVTT